MFPVHADYAANWYAEMLREENAALCDGNYDARNDALSQRYNRRLDLSRLVETLPRLGAVLWLERQSVKRAASIAFAPHCRLFVPDPGLSALCICRRLTAHSAVTPYGPREWLCFRDVDDVTRGKLFLLPDTDYFAWEELATQSVPLPAGPVSAWQRSFARLGFGWRARLLRFELHHASRLQRLDARPPAQTSCLGLELAGAIARTGHADFLAPAAPA